MAAHRPHCSTRQLKFAAGELVLRQGAALLASVAMLARLIEVDELVRRIDAREARTGSTVTTTATNKCRLAARDCITGSALRPLAVIVQDTRTDAELDAVRRRRRAHQLPKSVRGKHDDSLRSAF